METRELLEVYKSLYDTWRFEVNSHWQRSSYFAAFETVAVAACWKVLTDSSCQRWAGVVLSVLGIALTVVWFLSNNKTHEYAVFWLKAAGALEDKLIKRAGEQGIDFARQVKERTRTDSVYVKHPYLVQAPPMMFLVAWCFLLCFAIRLAVIDFGTVRYAITYEYVSLLVGTAALFLSAAATLIARSSLSQAKQVADRDQRDWKQRKWVDVYLKANEVYDLLDRFRVLSASWNTEEREREWNNLMGVIRGAHAMADVFPVNPAVDAFLSATAVFKEAHTVSEELLSKVLDAVELIRGKARIHRSIVEE